jgi:uncharacterized membrane-anchored protein
MKIMIRAALLVMSIGSIGTAYAGDGEGPVANTQFNELPSVIAQAPVQNNRAYAATQNGSGTALFVTHQESSAFPWNPNEGVGG